MPCEGPWRGKVWELEPSAFSLVQKKRNVDMFELTRLHFHICCSGRLIYFALEADKQEKQLITTSSKVALT